LSTSSKPAETVRLFILDEGAVLFSERREELHSLNTSATFVWCAMEEGMPRDDIAIALQRTFSISPDEARRYVADSFAQWHSLGLLDGAEAEEPERPQPVPAAGGADVSQMPPYPERAPVFAEERRYGLLGIGFVVRLETRVADDWVHPILAHLATATDPVGATVDVLASGASYVVYLDRRPVLTATSIDALAPLVKAVIWSIVVKRRQFLFYIHAGVVGVDGSCLLLPAAPGSGKSSLTAALAHSGYVYFSDEVALLEEASFRVAPMRLPLCVKSTGWDLIARYYPALGAMPAHRRVDGKIVRYLPPPGEQPPADGWPVSRLIFPRYREGEPTILRPLARVEALQRLMGECLAIPVRLDHGRVRGLIDWMKSIDCYDLTMSSLDEAVGLIRGLPAQTTRRSSLQNQRPA
jgi:hypothetical protein